MNDKCKNCSEYKRCKDSFASWIFFIIGLIATIAMRLVTVFIHLNPLYGKLAWYVGVGGFFIFFAYKFRVNKTRGELLEKNNLIEKLRNKETLSNEDSQLISSVLCGIRSAKEQINYFVIFILSAVVLAVAVYLDFIR
ncbi:MAG: hypothetical protein PHO00_00545 [bacterium]|nr:hypothetical protein [bacterium]